MTIQEAIKQAKEVAEEKYKEGFLCYANSGDIENDKKNEECVNCAKEHEQFADWLEELKQYQAIGTVEKFRKLKEEMNKKILTKEKIIELLYQHMQFLEDKSKSVETDKLIQISESINKIASTINSLSIHV